MKYLKTFENNDKPEVGDYVIIKLSTSYTKSEQIRKKFEDKIWRIESLWNSVIYKINSGVNDMYVNIHEIVNFSKDKEHLKLILKSEKYNL